MRITDIRVGMLGVNPIVGMGVTPPRWEQRSRRK